MWSRLRLSGGTADDGGPFRALCCSGLADDEKLFVVRITGEAFRDYSCAAQPVCTLSLSLIPLHYFSQVLDATGSTYSDASSCVAASSVASILAAVA